MNERQDPAARPPGMGLMALLVAAVVFSGILYLAAVVSGILAHGHAPHGSLVLGIAMLGHAGDPAAAWPAPERHLLGPPWLIWPLAALILGVTIGAAFSARRLVRHLASAQAAELPSAPDVAKANRALGAEHVGRRHHLTKRRTPEGIILGKRTAGRYDEPVLVMGVPGSGKSSWLARNIVHSPGATIVDSVKPELFALCAGAFAAAGRPVKVFDTEGVTHLPEEMVLRWSPIKGCAADLTRAKKMARRFAFGAGFEASATNGSYWTAATAKLLTWLFVSADLSGRGPGFVLEAVESPHAAREAAEVLTAHDHRDGAAALEDVLASRASSSDGHRSSIVGGLRAALDGFELPGLVAACTPGATEELDVADFLRRRGAIFVLGTAESQRAVGTVIAAMIEDLLEQVRGVARPVRPPMTLWLDEAANTAPLPSMATLTSTGRGEGLCPVVVLQSLAQGAQTWGRDGMDAIRAACVAELCFGGAKDVAYLQSLQSFAGERAYASRSVSYGDGASSETHGERIGARLSLDRLRSLPPHHAWLLLRHHAPCEVALDPWWESPERELIAASVERARRERWVEEAELPRVDKDLAARAWRALGEQMS